MTSNKHHLAEELRALWAQVEALKADVTALVQEMETTYGAPTPAVLEKLYGPRH